MNQFYKAIYYSLLLTLCFSALSGQEWIVRYNGPGNLGDYAYDITMDSSGNAYVTGWSHGLGGDADYATIKYASSGTEIWVARYDGPNHYSDEAVELAIDNSGNVYVTGRSHDSAPAANEFDFLTVKYDSSGAEQWARRYNGPSDLYDGATAIVVDHESNVYVTGPSDDSITHYDYVTIKYDSMGVEQWIARYIGPGNAGDWPTDIAMDNACNIYVTGISDLSGVDVNCVTVKYSPSGIEQWVAIYDGPYGGIDIAAALVVDDFNNVYLTGSSADTVSPFYDYLTIKYDSMGVEQWVARYNGWADSVDKAQALVVDSISSVYVTGYSWSGGYLYDYATVKYDSMGVEQWAARFNDGGVSWDQPWDIAIDSECNTYVTGSCHAICVTLKYNPIGQEQWVERYNQHTNSVTAGHGVAVDNNGYLYVAGETSDSGSSYDYITIKYTVEGGVESKPRFYRNPNHVSATILSGPLLLSRNDNYKIFNVVGQRIHFLNPSPGIYFIEIDGKITQKVVKVR